MLTWGFLALAALVVAYTGFALGVVFMHVIGADKPSMIIALLFGAGFAATWAALLTF